MKPKARTASASRQEIEPLVQRRRPVEHLDRGRDGDEHAQRREDHQPAYSRLAGDEHVVAPDEEAEHARWPRLEYAMKR